ncbi:MAG TPA: ClpXP protease specificity-enhancing factor [Steroidobacteraceae bacterium]|nr:ClpXP protease specificity-enhancing factor [Steroidobacteraceae bacterium]
MAQEPQLSSRRPYLLRAMHEWMTDNGQTPHLVVDAGIDGVVVPRQYVRDGKIVLNASYAATSALLLKNDWVTFSARFSGTAFEVRLPVNAVLGIYARETGQGMIFSDDAPSPDSPDPAPKPPGGDEARRPQLKIVK